MSFAQFMVIPVFIALQAFSMMLLAPKIPFTSEALGGGLITWISFQAWAMYFLGGCKITMALKTILGYAGGILASVAIFELGDLLVQHIGAYWGYPVAVLIVVIFVICFEKVPGLDFIPAWFVGAGVFFAFMGPYVTPQIEHTIEGYQSVAIPEMIACVIGLVYGIVTVAFRTIYEKSIAKKTPEKAAPES